MIMGEKDLINPNNRNEVDEDSKDELKDIEREQKELDKRKKNIIKDTIPAPAKVSVKSNNTTLQTTTPNVEVKQFYLGSILMDRFSI